MRTLLLIALAVGLGGCFNMPTPPNQISGTYVSDLNYENVGCDRLLPELDSLNRREAQLASAQQQRVKTSEMQAFMWGFGQGDSVEANELSSVRGQKEAVQKAIDVKKCTGH